MNKQSFKKVPRGQMIYAPISSLSSAQKPSKFILNSSIKDNKNKNTLPGEQNTLPGEQTQQTATKTQINNIQQLNQKVVLLSQQNQGLKKKEQIYLSKLQKLQSGLQKQHEQFRSLEVLYTQLFTTYKQKQDQISYLEQKYKQTERQRHQSVKQAQPNQSKQIFKNTLPRQNPYNSFNAKKQYNLCKEKLFQETITNQLQALIIQNQRLNQTNQNLLTEIAYLRSKDKLDESRRLLSNKVLQEVTHLQTLHEQGNQHQVKLQYQNQYLLIRNQDLQKSLSQLQNIISLKQTQIIRMREDKMAMHRKSSQKRLSKSPQKNSSDSANKRIQAKKLHVLIQNLQKQNNRLRNQNLQLRNFGKCSIKQGRQFHASPSRLIRKLNFAQKDNISNDSFSHSKQNINSQNLEQYFSFSKQKDQEELPSFPLDLQIQNIIQRHQQNFIMDKAQNLQE